MIYFAGDIDMYGDNFYETYKDYPGFIVAIPGNHDCQPDDPQDGPVDPNKFPLDGWIQNFMSKNPGQLGSLKTGVGKDPTGFAKCLLDFHDSVRDHSRTIFERRRNRG